MNQNPKQSTNRASQFIQDIPPFVKQLVAWALVLAITLLVNANFGTSFEPPPMPVAATPGAEDTGMAFGISHTTALDLTGDEVDQLVVNQTGTGDIVEFQDDGVVVWRLADGGIITSTGATLTSTADQVITDAQTLTPTVTTYNLSAVAGVTMTLAASGTEGQLLILCGDSAQDITIADTNTRTNDGAAQVVNQYDCITWIYIDTEWLELSESNNS